MREKNFYIPQKEITSEDENNKVQSFQECVQALNAYVENDVPGQKLLTLNFTLEIRKNLPLPVIALKNIEIRQYLGSAVYKFLASAERFFDFYPHKIFSFGKSLVYDPRDVFDSASQHLIDIFQEMHKYGMKDLFSKKEVIIPTFLLEKLIPVIPDLCTNYLYGDLSPEITITRGENAYQIDISDLKNWNVLGTNAIYYDGGEFYKIVISKEKTLSDIKYLKNFITHYNITTIDTNEFEIDTKKFVKKYSKIIKVNYPKNIENFYYTPKNIEPCLIFDIEQGVLTGSVDVLYDNKRECEFKEKISADINLVKQALYTAEKILVDNRFRPFAAKKFYLSGEERMYTFYNEKLKTLPALCPVFCTERLTKKKFSPVTISMNVKRERTLSIVFTADNLTDEEISEILSKIKERKLREYVRLKSGGIIRLDEHNVNEIRRTLMGLGATKAEILAGKLERKRYFEYFIDRDNSYNDDVIRDNDLTDFINLKFVPRNYQIVGIKWLLKLKKNKMGGILADDMGLGKTIQALTYLHINNKNKSGKYNLIVVPKSVLYNWENEINRYFTDMEYKIIFGRADKRKDSFKDINPGDLIITTYNLLSRDIDFYKDMEFDTLILDEAQNIKNNSTLAFKAIKKIKRETCFALTGTPIENHITELWNIFDAVLPGYLEKFQSFGENYMKSEEYEVFKYLINPFILRRMKAAVEKQLPQKMEKDIFAELEPEQRKIYSAFMLASQKAINKSKDIKPFMVLRHIFQLRMLCTYPSYIVKDYQETSVKEKILFELLDNLVENNHKIVVFSQFTSGLRILEQKLAQKYKLLTLTGDVAARKRAKLVDMFNRGKSQIFLISLKAGGVGLNITGADVVIHYDPWWNPAVEAQATDRVYRIGQEKNVMVYNLITKGTIEEYIHNMKKEKTIISEDVLDRKNNFKLSKQELLKIFS